MKKVLSLVLALVLFSSCHTPTPQELGQKLAVEEIKKSLLFPDSFDLIDCRVDSAFSPKHTPELIDKMLELSELIEKAKTAERDLYSKERKYEINKIYGTRSSYLKYEFEKSKKEYEAALERYEKIGEKIRSIGEHCIKLQSEKPAFYGWIIMTGYRAQNNAGQTIISHDMIIADKEFNLLSKYSEEELESILSTSKWLNEE